VQHLEYKGMYHRIQPSSIPWRDKPPAHPLCSLTISSPNIESTDLAALDLFPLAHDILHLFGPTCEVAFRSFHRSYHGYCWTPDTSSAPDTRAALFTQGLRKVMSGIIAQTRSARAPGWSYIGACGGA
jgi:hypothetical protein